MDAARIKICSVVGFLGVLAFIICVIAEVIRLQTNNVSFSDLGVYTCRFPKNAVTLPLGLLAALCILVAQIVANAFGGCVCCFAANKTKDSPSPFEEKKAAAIMCLVFSWIVSISSTLWLLMFGLANVLTSNDPMISQQGCPTPFPGGLITGGVLGMMGTVLAIMFYLLATSRPDETEVVMPVSMPTATAVTPCQHERGATQGEVRIPVTTLSNNTVPLPPPQRSGEGVATQGEVRIPVTTLSNNTVPLSPPQRSGKGVKRSVN